MPTYRQSDWTKRNLRGGVLTDGKVMAYQNHGIMYFGKCFVCPENVNFYPFLYGFIQQ